MRILANLNVVGTLDIDTVTNAGADTDRFLVQDASGLVRYRTGAEVASDIGAGNLAASTLKHLVKLGVAATKGQAVYVSSADGTNMIVSKASNDAESTSSKTLGLLETGGAINDQVYVVTEGLLAGLDTSTATAGDPVWLGTNGNLIFGLTNKPYAPAHLVFIGIVTRVQQNNGEIFVKVQNGFELQELHNVQITSAPADNTVLSYETSSSLYKMKSIPTLLGYTPADDAGVVHIAGTETITGTKTFTATTTTFAKVVANSPAGGATGEGIVVGKSFKLDASGTDEKAKIYVVSKDLSDTYGSGLQIQFANLADDKGFGFNLNTTGGYELYTKDANSSWVKVMTASNAQIVNFVNTPTVGAYTVYHTGNLNIGSLNGVPSTRQLTINGVTYDLSADRTWTINGIDGSGTANYVAKFGTSTQITNSQIRDDGTTVGINSAPNINYQLIINTNLNDGTLALQSSANVNSMYFLKAGTKLFEISYDTTSGAKLFRLLPYQTGSIFEVGNPSNAGNDYVLISENTYGNVLIGPGLTNGQTNITGATAATHKIQFNGAVFGNSSIQANSFVKTGGTSSQYLMADGSVTTSGVIGGSGTANQMAYWNGSSSLTGSSLFTVDATNGYFVITGGATYKNADIWLNRYSNAWENAIRFQTNGTTDWYLGSSATGSNSDLEFYSYGTTSAALTLIRSNANANFGGSVGINNTSLTGYSIRASRTMVGDTATGITSYGIVSDGVIQSGVTSGAFGFNSALSTASATFTLDALIHYRATQGSISGTSTVNNQYGFAALGTMTGATNNYGFFGSLDSATGRWNLYMSGTASNYLAGNTGIGTNTIGSRLQVNGNAAIGYSASTAAATNGLAVAGQLYISTLNWPTSSVGNSANRHIFGGSTTPILLLWNEATAAANNQSNIWIGAKSAQGATYIGGGYIAGGLENATDSKGFIRILTTDNLGGQNEWFRIGSNGLATFSSDVSIINAAAAIMTLQGASGNSKNIFFKSTGNADNSIRLYQDGGTNNFIIATGDGTVAPTNRLTISSTGAATFSSTISAGGGAFGAYLDPQISVRKDSNAPISIYLSNQANNVSGAAYYAVGTYGNSWYFGMGSSTSTYGVDFVLRSDITTNNSPAIRVSTAGNTTFGGNISAGAGTFTSDITVNGLRVGRGPGNDSSNTAFGNGALFSHTGSFVAGNTAIGSSALYSTVSSATQGFGNTAVGFGSLTTNSSGQSNTAIGTNSGQLINGNYNVLLGRDAFSSATSGNNNTMVGYGAGSQITSGNNNTIIGNYNGPVSALSGNVVLSDGLANIRFLHNGTVGKLPFLTSNGFIKTSGSDGTLSVDTNAYAVYKSSTLSLPAATYNGWYKIARSAQAVGGWGVRGAFRIIIAQTGNNQSPSQVIINGYKDWGTTVTLSSVEDNLDATTFTQFRITTSGDYSYLEAYINWTSPGGQDYYVYSYDNGHNGNTWEPLSGNITVGVASPSSSYTLARIANTTNFRNLNIQGSSVLNSSNYNSYALPLTGGTLTGALSGTSATFSGNVRKTGAAGVYTELQSDGVYATGTDLYLLAPSTKGVYIYTNNTQALSISSTGAASFSSSVSMGSLNSGSILSQVADTGVGTKTIIATLERTGASPSGTQREVGLVFKDGNNGTLVGGITGIRYNSSGNYLGGLRLYVQNSTSTPATSFSNLLQVLTIDYAGTATFDYGVSASSVSASSLASGTFYASGQFTTADADQWPYIYWHRDTGNNWDEGLIKGSSARGFFGRSGFGIHMSSTRNFHFFSSGWDALFGIEGGTGNARIKGNFLPQNNGTQNLGGTSNRWATVYTSDLDMSNGIGDYTIVEGYEDLFLYNNKTGKVFKFNLTEVDKSEAPPKKIR